jgi:phytoene dehydrogenase-like protein
LDRDGVYAPKGGMYEIINFFAKILKLQNVDIKLEFRVNAIKDQVVYGDHEYHKHFDLIVSSLDPTLTARLIGTEPPKKAAPPLSCSVVGLFGAVAPDISSTLPFQQVVMPHNTANFFAQLEAQELPESTMVFIHNYPQGDSINPDPTHATMAMLFTVPAKVMAKQEVEQFLRRQSLRVAKLLKLKVEPSTHSPLESLWLREPAQLGPEYYGEFGHPSGALYGHLQKPKETGPFHPVPYQSSCGWLWQVGAGVHPGGGIPGTVGGALIAVNKMLLALQKSPQRKRPSARLWTQRPEQ